MIITIAHQKGGVGKSTLAVNLAIMLQRKLGEPVDLIDMDMQQSATLFDKRRIKNGLAGMNVLHATSIDAIKAAKKKSSYTIIDVGGFDADINRAAIAAADVVITPVSDSTIELDGLQSFRSKIIAEIRKIKPDIKATVLLNRVHQFASKSLEEIFEYARAKEEFDIFETVIRDRSEFKKSFEFGKSVEEFAPGSKAAEEIHQLIRELTHGKI